jgi:hypothetical protein
LHTNYKSRRAAAANAAKAEPVKAEPVHKSGASYFLIPNETPQQRQRAVSKAHKNYNRSLELKIKKNDMEAPPLPKNKSLKPLGSASRHYPAYSGDASSLPPPPGAVFVSPGAPPTLLSPPPGLMPPTAAETQQRIEQEKKNKKHKKHKKNKTFTPPPPPTEPMHRRKLSRAGRISRIGMGMPPPPADPPPPPPSDTFVWSGGPPGM